MFNKIIGLTSMDMATMKNVIKNLSNDQLKNLVQKLTELLQSNIMLPTGFRNNLNQAISDIVNSDKSTWKDKLTAFVSNTENFNQLSTFGPQIMQALNLK